MYTSTESVRYQEYLQLSNEVNKNVASWEILHAQQIKGFINIPLGKRKR